MPAVFFPLCSLNLPHQSELGLHEHMLGNVTPPQKEGEQHLCIAGGFRTWRDRLGIMQVTPKPTRSRLVKMKALVALTIFWIRLSGRRGCPGSLQKTKIVLYIFFLFYFLSKRWACSPFNALVVLILALFEFPIHDVTNDRRGDQTQKLEHAKDGGVDAHWETKQRRWSPSVLRC